MTLGEAHEGYIPVTGGRVWYQIVGSGDATPLLVLHGGPGIPHDYLEPLADLAAERPVVFYDQLGCGKSDRPDDVSLWRIDRFAEEVGQVRQALGLAQVHLLGHSGGTMVALDYLLDQPVGVISLIQVGPVLSAPRALADINRLYATLPEEVLATVKRHEAAGTLDSEEYQQAVEEYSRRYMNRVRPKPESSQRASQGVGVQVFHTVWGPYELQVTGNLKDYDRTDRAHEISIPTLFICGRYDASTPEETARYHHLVDGSELVIFEQSSHSPFIEEREHFMQVVGDFLRRVEARLGE
ncbi:MAG: proline iminopeptidase-family hydrolase [Caldilineaceae bacterium]|nr:proline iminopeptidase-family hydrolase [Caldilineaceae bacterium]